MTMILYYLYYIDVCSSSWTLLFLSRLLVFRSSLGPGGGLEDVIVCFCLRLLAVASVVDPERLEETYLDTLSRAYKSCFEEGGRNPVILFLALSKRAHGEN